MKVISLIAQKGGSAKTTNALHLATYAHSLGLSTAIIDLDPQASAWKWGEKRKSEPEVVTNHAELLPQLLASAKANGADLIVIDTPPAADRVALAAAKAGDLLIIPCRPTVLDLEAIATTNELAQIAKKPAYVVFSAVPSRGDLMVADARRGLQSRGVEVAPVMIHQRVAFSHSLIDGRTAMEFEPDGKGAREVRDLFKWAGEQLGFEARKPVNKAA